jgi:acyl-CoA dehydrogenase
MSEPGGVRDDLTKRAIFIPTDSTQALARLERAFELSNRSSHVYSEIRKAVKDGRLAKGRLQDLVKSALQSHVISQTDVDVLKTAEEARQDVIAVDEFTLEAYRSGKMLFPANPMVEALQDVAIQA